jgi:aquaporin Z
MIDFVHTVKKNFVLYCCEALGLGMFMFCAGLADVVIDHPDLPIHSRIHSALLRRFLIGLLMGVTALYILNSPFGKKSGAHINPSVTIVQYRLGNIDKINSIFYILFQFLGGSLGMFFIYLIIPRYIKFPTINYIVTQPFNTTSVIAFICEFSISFILIVTVLYSNTNKKLSKLTAYFVAVLITVFITFEAPFTGMSMNPARTFSSAIVSGEWKDFWLYCIAPPLGMICGELFVSKILRKPLENVTLHND